MGGEGAGNHYEEPYITNKTQISMCFISYFLYKRKFSAKPDSKILKRNESEKGECQTDFWFGGADGNRLNPKSCFTPALPEIRTEKLLFTRVVKNVGATTYVCDRE